MWFCINVICLWCNYGACVTYLYGLICAVLSVCVTNMTYRLYEFCGLFAVGCLFGLCVLWDICMAGVFGICVHVFGLMSCV